MEILKNLNDFNAPIQAIEEKLFDVQKVQYPSPMEGFNQPKAWGIYKTTGGQELGTVGSRYEPIQPKEFLHSLVNGVVESGLDLDISKLKYDEYYNGEKIAFTLPLETIGFKNDAKVDDVIETYLTFTTTFNGTGSSTLGIFSKRLICTNGWTSTKKDCYATYKHTINSNVKALIHANEITKITNVGLKNQVERFKLMNETQVTKAQQNALLEKITGYDFKNYKEAKHKTRSIMDKINESVAIEQRRTGTTLWGLLNGITYYTNHVASEGKNQQEYILFASGAKLNKKAETVLTGVLEN